MPVILYGTRASPPYRAVLLTAKALGLVLEERFIDLIVETPGNQWIRTPNIPTLEDNGFIINKTNDILTHLVDKYGINDSLYPRDPVLRSDVCTMLSYSSNFYDCIEEYFEPALFGQPVRLSKKIQMYDFLSIFEKKLESRWYAAAERLTIADFSILSTFSVMKSLAHDLSGFQRICAWEQRTKDIIPFYDEVTQEGILMFNARLAHIL